MCCSSSLFVTAFNVPCFYIQSHADTIGTAIEDYSPLIYMIIPWYCRTEELEELQKKILEDMNYVEVCY